MTAPLATSAAKEAFSRQAPVFDAIDVANPLIGWVRDRVRRACMQYIRPGQSLLELNAGTGIDSAFFAQQGVQVLATDQAPGMLARLGARVREDLPLHVMELSFLDLQRLRGRTFDHVFSNFGGLNCTDRLDKVMQDAHALLKPGGCMHLVIMPRVCLWELGWVFRGRFRSAFRRFRRGGTPAHLEGVTFDCHYYSPSDVIRMLPAGYTVRRLMALSLTYPPPHAQAIADGWPRTTRLLERLEKLLCTLPPFRGWGDHYLLIVERDR